MRHRRRRGRHNLSFHEKQKRKFNKQLFYELLSWGSVIVVAVFFSFVLIMFFGIKTSMVGSSMEPVIYSGQNVLINRVAYNMTSPKRGDIIVFKPNGNKNSHLYIKRVVGLPGETIKISNGKVYINGTMFLEDVVSDTKEAGIAVNDVVLDTDEYFVLGDNRTNSEDSRSANIGNVKNSMIEGADGACVQVAAGFHNAPVQTFDAGIEGEDRKRKHGTDHADVDSKAAGI